MAKKMNVVDKLVGWGIQRYAYARNQWKANIDPEDRSLTASMLSSVTPTDDPFAKMSYEERMRKARTVSWIYSDIRIFANMFSGAAAQVIQIEGESRNSVKNHAFEQLLRKPNELIDGDFLWQYSIKWLMLSRLGAFWFLAPERGNPDQIAEIWPIPSNKILPIPDKEKLVKGYLYELNSGQKVMIDPRYVE